MGALLLDDESGPALGPAAPAAPAGPTGPTGPATPVAPVTPEPVAPDVLADMPLALESSPRSCANFS